jgi:hypothetical protein
VIGEAYDDPYRSDAVNPDEQDQIGELATELDDLSLTVEEIQADPPPGIDPAHLDAVIDALEEASDATDNIVTERDTSAS